MPGAVSSWKAASFCKTILTHQKTLCSQFAWGKILCWPLLASCYWTQAQAGGFSVCSFVTTRINVQYTSFFYSEKPVLGVKEGKSMTRSRDSKGIASMRRDKWRDQWPKDKSTLAKSLFLSFEMSSLCLFSLLLSWTFFFTVLFSFLFSLSSHSHLDFSLCSSAFSPQHLLHETENNNVQQRLP